MFEASGVNRAVAEKGSRHEARCVTRPHVRVLATERTPPSTFPTSFHVSIDLYTTQHILLPQAQELIAQASGILTAENVIGGPEYSFAPARAGPDSKCPQTSGLATSLAQLGF